MEAPTSEVPSALKSPERNPMQELLTSEGGYPVESIQMDDIMHAGEPAQFYRGLRERFVLKESGVVAPGLGNDYRDPSLVTSMYERETNLRKSGDQLIHERRILGYDKDTGTGILQKMRYASVAIDRDAMQVRKDSQGNTFYLIDIGTPERREAMAIVYHNGFMEMNARVLTGEQIGTLLDLRVRDDLATLVDWEHGTSSTYKAEHFHSLFNLPSVREMEEIPTEKLTPQEIKEKHELGDQIEKSMLAEMIMMKSGSKQDIKDLLVRPGTKFLIAKMAKEEQDRRQKEANKKHAEDATYYKDQQPQPVISYTYNDWVKEFVGDVDNWTDDMQRDLKTWRTERNDGRRGRLTKWGNLCAFAGDPGEISTDEENHFIEKEVGAAAGSVEAAWIATTIFRNVGVFASEGYLSLPNGISHLPLGEFKYITGDDRGKFYPLMFAMKEGLAGRSAELKEMLNRSPDMAMNLLDWSQVLVDGLYETDEAGVVIYGSDGKPKIARRSIMDAWLGTAEQPKIDLLTGGYAEYGIKAVKVDLINDDVDKNLVAKGELIKIKGTHPRNGEKDVEFYVTKEDYEKIKAGEKMDKKDYEKIFDPPKNEADKKAKEELKDKVARLVIVKAPDGSHERQLYMPARDEEKIINNGGILMKEVDPKTGETIRVFYGKKVQEEGYHRLGSLNFGSLERYFHGTFGTMQWLMGREKGGVLSDIKNVDDFGVGDFLLRKFKNQRKYDGITLNLITLTKGSPQLYDAGRVTYDGVSTYEVTEYGSDGSSKDISVSFHEVQTTATKTIQRTLLKNQMAARVRTSNWVLNVMDKPANASNLDLGILAKKGVDIPLSNVLEAFCKEALKPFPKNQEEILKNYFDDLDRIQTLTDPKRPLEFYKEMGNYLNSWKSKLVGGRKGRKADFLYERLN